MSSFTFCMLHQTLVGCLLRSDICSSVAIMKAITRMANVNVLPDKY